MVFSFRRNKKNQRIYALILTGALVLSFAAQPVISARAATSAELKKQQSQTQSQLNNAEGEASSLQSEQSGVSSALQQKTSEIAENMAAIGVMEDEITDLESQIEVKTTEYQAAQEEEKNQYESMKKRIQFMYEKGDTNYVQLLITASSFGDMLNKAEYVDQMYDYDRKMLIKFEEAVQAVADAKKALEDEKSELETTQAELQENQSYLESQKAELQDEYDNYDDLIAEAQSDAAELRAKIKQQNSQIQTAEAEEAAAEAARKQAEADAAAAAAAAAGTTTTDSTTSSEGSSTAAITARTYSSAGSASGSNVASYACQFVGNPYVYGGTSLTSGADCSGFTQSVYAAFGYSIPRTSYSQKNAGTAVDSLADAQPGDLICYGGHVAIYIGNGQIVHASTPATGIKYGYAAYRTILGIRRIIN
jgi:cell wall-associated NlpC family hydrolase